MDRKALKKLSYGLFVLTAHDGEKDNGCIINTAIQAASAPNQVSICVNKENFTHDMIVKTGKFNISVISEKADFELFKHFGFQSGRNTDKFASFQKCHRAENGILFIESGTNAYFSVNVDTTVDLGSHTMFIGGVTEMEVINDEASATYSYYFENIKPKSEKKETKNAEQKMWRCRICGFEYMGDELPEEYICPTCKHPASDFDPVS